MFTINGTKAEATKARPGRRPRNVAISPIYVPPLTSWTIDDVRAALEEHEQGRMYTAACLLDSMRRDFQLAGDLNTRIRALSSRAVVPLVVEPSDEGDGRRRVAVANRTRALWWSVIPETEIVGILRDSIMLGVAVGRIHWTLTKGEWRPRLQHLPAHGLTWQPWTRSWTYTTGDGEVLEVTPGDGTWFLHLPNGERSFLDGCIRSTAEPWIRRQYLYRSWLRYCEKHGLGLLAVKEPFNAHDDVEGDGGSEGTAAEGFYAQFTDIGSEITLRLPQGQTKDDPGWDAEWMELVSNTWETFRALLQDQAAAITISILGRDPNTQVSKVGGDGSAILEKIRTEYLASDAEPLSTSLRDQVWKPDVAYNVDPSDLELAAWGRWNTRPAPDLKQRAETLKTVAEAIEKLRVDADTAPILEEFGLTPAPKPAPTTPAPTPGPGSPEPANDEQPEEPAPPEAA